MYRISGLIVGLCLTGVVAYSPAMAQTSARPTAATYAGKTVTFNYPDNFKRLSASQAHTIGAPMASLGHGLHLISTDGVIRRAKGVGAIAVMVKIGFSKKLQSQLNGQHTVFLNGVLKGIADSSGIKVLSRGNSTLGGQPARTIDVTSSGSSASHQQYYVSISKDQKACYMALFLTVPIKGWSAYSPTFKSIAHSARFK